MENIGEKIYKARKEKHVSQEKLAEEVNVARQTVSKWERDIAQPTMENIKSLCVYFGVEFNYFLSDKEIAEIKEVSAVQNAVTQSEDKKESKFKSLKIVSIVAGMVLLALFVIASGVAAYVTIAPDDEPYVDSVHIVNYGGIIFLVIGVVAASIFISLSAILINKCIKNRKNK